MPLPQNERENLITRINYSPKIKAALAAGTFFSIGLVGATLEREPFKPVVPDFARGHVFDFFGGLTLPFFYSTVRNELSKKEVGALTVMLLSTWEAAQNFNGGFERFSGAKDPGTFDLWDYPAYALGIMGWLAFDGLAKKLYDSGATIPIYRALKIQDRRTRF